MADPRPVPSPCTSVCRIDPVDGWCEGCLRTIDEIAAWSTLDDPARRAIWVKLRMRRAEVHGSDDATKRGPPRRPNDQDVDAG